MKKNYLFTMLILSMLFVSTSLFLRSCEDSDACHELYNGWQGIAISEEILDSHYIIAHGGGGIDGETYTNCLEAIDFHYQNGTRIFEIDFLYTEDKEIVAAHYWENVCESYSFQNKPKLEDFKATHVREKYTPLSLEDLLNLMNEEYTEFLLVVDTKQINYTEFYSDLISLTKSINTCLLNRIIPQLYDFDMLDDLNSISDIGFSHYILTLYKINATPNQVIEYLQQEEKIDLLVMFPNRYSEFTENHIDELRDLDIRVYLHTLNHLDTILNYTDGYVKGVYSDFVTENEYVEQSKDVTE